MSQRTIQSTLFLSIILMVTGCLLFVLDLLGVRMPMSELHIVYIFLFCVGIYLSIEIDALNQVIHRLEKELNDTE